MFSRARERPLLIKNRHIVSKPAAEKGPAMVAPNLKALQANNNNRRPLGNNGNLVGGLNAQCNIKKDGVRKRAFGDIGNLVEDLNAECNISKDGVRKRSRANLVVYSDKGASSSTQDSFRDVRKDPPSIDDGDIDNQLAVVEYVEDIYQFYRETENMSCVPPDYMRSQLEIKENMRGILIDWLIEVHLIYELMPETLYLTVNIIDRYLSIRSVKKKELQLLGITAMLIASKYEETWFPKVNELFYISADAYTSKQIVDMECTILNQLKCNLTVPTPYVFLVRFLKAAGPDEVMENLAFFLVDLCLLHYIMIKYSPSMLAAAAVYTAQCTLKKHPYWSKILTHHTGYSEADLKECAHFMVDFHLNAEGNKLKAVHKKYLKPFFGSVASLSPANLPAGTVAAPANHNCAHEI